MSLDRRLRTGLARSSTVIREHNLDRAFDDVVRGARRRLVVRRIVAVVLTLAFAVGGAFLAPKALDALRGNQIPATPSLPETQLTVRLDGLGFSADGRLLFGIGRGGRGEIRDAMTGRLREIVDGRGETVVAFSPDGSMFVTARGCGNCNQPSPVSVLHTYVFDTSSGQQVWDFRKACCFVAFSADSELLALPYNGMTKVVDVSTGHEVALIDAFGNFAFSPDGKELVVTGEKGTIGEVFRISDPALPVLTLRGKSNGPFETAIAWSPDGSTIATNNRQGSATLWDADTGARELLIQPPAGRFSYLAFGADPTELATGSTDGAATVWRLSDGGAKPFLRRDASGGADKHTFVSLSPDGRRLTATASGLTDLWTLPRR